MGLWAIEVSVDRWTSMVVSTAGLVHAEGQDNVAAQTYERKVRTT